MGRRESADHANPMEVAMRERLSNRRANESFTVESLNLKFTITAGWFPDGRLAEIFTVNHRAQSAAGILASDASIAASLALQFGCPAHVLRKALCRDSQGRASGPLGAALDAIAEREADN
jgi:ribonucleoside-diphosphate reductase alpha chain